MRPLRRSLLPSPICYLTSWLSPRTSTLWRTSPWPWPVAPPQPHRSTSNATGSGFTRTTTWLSGLLTQPQVLNKSLFEFCIKQSFLAPFAAEMSSVFNVFLDVVCFRCMTRLSPCTLYVLYVSVCMLEVHNLPVITVLHQALSSSSSLFSLPVS